MSTLQLSRELSGMGHEIDLYYETPGELEAEYRAFCRSITPAHLRVRRPGLLSNLRRAAPALSSAARRHPDVVYVQSFGNIPFGALVARLSRAPLVCHLRGFASYGKTKLLASQVSRFIAVSHDTRQRWSDAGVDASRIEVVHNGVDLDDYPLGGQVEREASRKQLGIPPRSFVVLYYGRLDKEKGVEVLLDAWRKSGIPESEGRLVIMGEAVIDPDPDASLRRLQELAPPGCVWLPSRRDAVTALHAADVVAVPSFAEGFPRTIIETMATGRPVVASRVGGIPESLAPPFDRYLFEPGDATALSRALASLRGWRQEDPGLAYRCRRHVADHFTLEKTAAGVEDVLAAVAGRNTAREELHPVPVGR